MSGIDKTPIYVGISLGALTLVAISAMFAPLGLYDELDEHVDDNFNAYRLTSNANVEIDGIVIEKYNDVEVKWLFYDYHPYLLKIQTDSGEYIFEVGSFEYEIYEIGDEIKISPQHGILINTAVYKVRN